MLAKVGCTAEILELLPQPLHGSWLLILSGSEAGRFRLGKLLQLSNSNHNMTIVVSNGNRTADEIRS